MKLYRVRCFASLSEPVDVLVLSDLKVDGYVMADRFERLDLEHARLTLSKLAKFHAAGVLYRERVCVGLIVDVRIAFIDLRLGLFTGGRHT